MLLRRFANALLGSGPWRLAPFAVLAESRTAITHGVHRPEDFSGILHHEAGENTYYHAGVSLLDQPATCAQLIDGPRYVEHGLCPTSPRTVYALTHAGVIGSDGLIYCRKSRRAVKETVKCWTQPLCAHPALGAPGLPPARRLPGISVSLLTLSAEGFYHFLLESIPRLRLLHAWLRYADHILVPGKPGGFQERWLRHAGVEIEKIVWMQGLCHMACDQLLFTSHPFRDYQPSTSTVNAIRDSFPEPPPLKEAPKLLWISRRDAVARLLKWESDLLKRLPGFVPLELSSLSPALQIAHIAAADVIAGPHGAGLANVVFARSGARLIELFPNQFRQPIYARLSSIREVHHGWAVTDFNNPENIAQLANAICRFASA